MINTESNCINEMIIQSDINKNDNLNNQSSTIPEGVLTDDSRPKPKRKHEEINQIMQEILNQNSEFKKIQNIESI